MAKKAGGAMPHRAQQRRQREPKLHAKEAASSHLPTLRFTPPPLLLADLYTLNNELRVVLLCVLRAICSCLPGGAPSAPSGGSRGTLGDVPSTIAFNRCGTFCPVVNGSAINSKASGRCVGSLTKMRAKDCMPSSVSSARVSTVYAGICGARQRQPPAL